MATKTSIGLIELGSIAGGFQVTDAMLKAADVELVLARTICSGKYMVMVKGDTAAVEAAVQVGKQRGDFDGILIWTSCSSASSGCASFHFPIAIRWASF